jgi:X-X-X-Leu-X-X-Gly heptad repeat protein
MLLKQLRSSTVSQRLRGRPSHLHPLGEKKISESLAQGSNTLAEKVNQIDSGLKISETASTTSRTVNEQWSHVDQAYHVSAGTASVGQAVSGWGASFVSGLSSAFQNPTVQTTLSSVSEWTNNVGRSLGTMIQPAADTVAREFNEIKVQSAREIELKRKEREEAEGGIILDNLDDLGGEAVFNVSAPSSSLSVPAEGLEEIPPPSDPSETEI